MREKINRLASGDIDVDMPELELEPTSISQMVKMSSLSKVELNINTNNNIAIKGLLYSSNYRVRLLNKSFGGLKNKIILEVDTSYLNVGDVIDGEITAITNAGEFIIPYRFTTFSNKTSSILGELKTIKDFLLIYREDRETALKIFEFKDFIEAPFMKDYRYRSIYENFIIRVNKALALEEFLIAINAKKRVNIDIGREEYIFDNIEEDSSFNLTIRRNTWGYLLLSISNDVDFIEIDKKNLSDTDFDKDECILNINILAQKLKEGVNKATISFKNVYIDKEISIEIRKDKFIEEKPKSDRENYIKDKKKICSYLKYRLKYEFTDGDEKEILPELMQLELDDISSSYDRYVMANLLLAETYLLRMQYDKAKDIIDLVREDVLSIEEEYSDEYLLMEYMLSYIENNYEKKEGLVKLLSGLEEENRDIVFLLRLKLDENISVSPSLKYEYLLKSFDKGNKSKFLYIAYINLLNENPAFLHDIGIFELKAFMCGIEEEAISDELYLILKQRLGTLPIYSNISYYMLLKLYKKFLNDEYIYALCRFIIRADLRRKDLHKWFELAIEKDMNISLLYEYYIYTLDEDYDKLLPLKVFEYFAHNNVLDLKYKSLIYENILKYTKEEDDLYKSYIHDIERFVLSSLKVARLDKHLAFIYSKIIKAEMIDENLARYLPSILNSYKMSTKNSYIKAVAVIYPELKKEYIYNIEGNDFYLPIFSETAIVLECDIYGNRYANFDLEIIKMFNLDTMLDRCYELSSFHPILRLEFAKKILEKSSINEREVGFLEDMLKSAELTDSFKAYIFSKLVYYYRNLGKEASGVEVWESRNHDILIKTNKDDLDNNSKAVLIDTFISMGYFGEAYEMLKKYKCFNISIRNINILVERMILDKIFKKDYLLLYISNISFMAGNRSSILLDYLCEYYNNDSNSMYELLEVSIKDNIESYDLEERLLAQLFFVGNRDLLDRVFAWYVSRKKSSEILVKAYFGIKSSDYIFYDIDIQERVIEYLENALAKEEFIDRIPSIYKLAILKYYSRQELLVARQKEYAKILLDNLLSLGLEFPFYKDLARFIDVPENILDKQILLYIANNREVPSLYSRLSKKEDFLKEDFINIYRNIYIKSKILFDDEEWEYEIYASKSNDLLAKGSIKNTLNKKVAFSRYTLINDIINYKDDVELEELMQDFMMKETLSKKMFTLI